MKSTIRARIAALGAGAIIAAVAGCGSDSATDSSTTVPTGDELVGTWTQTGEGFGNGAPITWENQTIVIESANGQGFTGVKQYTDNGQPQTELINGVIGVDGTVLIVDDDGRFEGRLTDGKLQGQ
jgi:hypothetical protein